MEWQEVYYGPEGCLQMLAQGEGTFQNVPRRLGEESDSEYVQCIVEFGPANLIDLL